MRDRSLLQEAKDRLTIPQVWERLGLPGQPRRQGRSPFREDRTPSFSIYEDGRRWRDFATGAGGDVADFLACALEVEPREGARRLIRMAGLTPEAKAEAPRAPIPRREEKAEREARRSRWPVLEPCTDAALERIAEVRGLSVAGVRLAAERGLLWTAESREGAAWVLTDSRRVNAQARRMDGQPWERIGAKAWTLPGSEAAWPIGLPECAGYPMVALVEGGPDLLAACHLPVQGGVEEAVAPVAMLGAAQMPPREARPYFLGKRVRLYGHADEAGRQAVRRWAGVVAETAREVDAFFPTEGDLNDFARRAGETHGEAMACAQDLRPVRVCPDEREARRIAGELRRMYDAGVISGPDDPDAALYAATMRTFRGGWAGLREAA